MKFQENVKGAMVNVTVKAQMKLDELITSQRGDTNFISIIIILGIVILLVIVFRKYITDILATVGDQISKFFSEGSGDF
jgi:predicted RND superfamily exporter protein